MKRAIIVGSGIAGLAAAIALRRTGVDVTVYEREAELTEAGAGISLWANALRALESIGAGSAVRAVALPADLAEFRARNGFAIMASFQVPAFERRFGTSPFIAMVHRADLVAALAGCLPAGTARYGFECVGAERQGERVMVRFQNGHRDEADFVVGADGIRSALRARLLGPEKLRYAGYTCWRGVCPRPALVAPGYLAEWWGRGRRFGITTLPGDRVYWWATKNEPAGGRAGEEKSAVAVAFQDWADPVPALIGATPAEAVLRNDIIDRAPNQRWAVDRAVFIGDAAHPTTPNLGQGGCLAIEDAVVLAQCLTGPGTLQRRIASFISKRYPRAAAITNQSWRFGRIGQWEGRVSCWLRDGCAGLLLPVFGSESLPKHAVFDVGPLPAAAASGPVE